MCVDIGDKWQPFLYHLDTHSQAAVNMYIRQGAVELVHVHMSPNRREVKGRRCCLGTEFIQLLFLCPNLLQHIPYIII